MQTNNPIIGLYRHFKGGYYLALTTARVEADGSEVVVYQSLQNGMTFTRPVESFTEEVPAGKENPTGQKYRMERVTNYENQLNLIPTEKLVEELDKRMDSPYIPESSESIWREEYLVGRFQSFLIEESNICEDFDIICTFDTLKEAEDFIEQNYYGENNIRIIKRLYVKVD